MRLVLLCACAAVLATAYMRSAPRPAPEHPVDVSPQPIGVTAALLMDARMYDARAAGPDALPVPRDGRGPLVAVGDAGDAARAGAKYFVPAYTLLRTTPLTFSAPEVEIAPRELWSRRAQFRIIDVREEDEFAASRVPGSVRRSMFADFTREAKPVALFCLTGHRSAALVQRLHQRGVKTVYSVRGGWLDWKAQRLPLESS